jgi:hypothetical protein
MAHELKSPLATVELYANLLLRELAGEPAALHQLGVIKDQTRSCLERIRTIMHSINPDAARVGGTALTPLVPVVHTVVYLGDLPQVERGEPLRGHHEGHGAAPHRLQGLRPPRSGDAAQR